MDSDERKMNSKRTRGHSPTDHKDGHTKERDRSGRTDISKDLRTDNSKDLEIDTSNARSRHSDRHSYGTSRESRRHDDHSRYHGKRADDNERSHTRTSRSDRELRTDTYYERSKRDSTFDGSRGDWRNVESRYGDKSNKREHVSKNKEIVKQEENLKKRSGEEIKKTSTITEPEVENREKRRSLFSSVGPDVESAQHNEKSGTSEKKPSLDCSGGFKEEGTMDTVNAAKVAAMKAAELVNKNLVGFGVGTGRLSTDQKKKLLWGNKKSNPPESSTHWDSNLFSDRERQEKFNKLMGVKSSTSASASAQEVKVDNKDGSSSEAKKHEELETDLEKHYIAGLRRRDGRTVGLGL